MAFSEVRQYQPGDEIRTIDWNVTARMNEPYVKVFTEERELTVMLLVDVSASQGVRLAASAPRPRWPPRSPRRSPSRAIANNDRVGLVLFTDRVEGVRRGRAASTCAVGERTSFRPEGRGRTSRSPWAG